MVLNVVKPTPTISFTESELVLQQGYTNVSIAADVATPDVLRTISKVELFLDGNSVSTRRYDGYDVHLTLSLPYPILLAGIELVSLAEVETPCPANSKFCSRG